MGLQEKLSKNSLKAVEDDLELLYKEDQLKMNSLDIMIPLHLNQVKKKRTLLQTFVKLNLYVTLRCVVAKIRQYTLGQ